MAPSTARRVGARRCREWWCVPVNWRDSRLTSSLHRGMTAAPDEVVKAPALRNLDMILRPPHTERETKQGL